MIAMIKPVPIDSMKGDTHNFAWFVSEMAQYIDTLQEFVRQEDAWYILKDNGDWI